VKVLDHPTHSPDLTPRDFHLLLHLKKHLASQNFHKDEEVITWLHVKVVEFYDIGIQILLPRQNKFLDKAWDDVEK
jgi:hypothetical protein